jgi:hypothetical protein
MVEEVHYLPSVMKYVVNQHHYLGKLCAGMHGPGLGVKM